MSKPAHSSLRDASIYQRLSLLSRSIGKSDLTNSEALYIQTWHGGIIKFCNAFGLPGPTRSARVGNKIELERTIISIIIDMSNRLGYVPTSREVAIELKAKSGYCAKYLSNFNRLLGLAGLEPNRTCAVSEADVISRLETFKKAHNYFPLSHDLKSSIGICSNSSFFKRAGGYSRFMQSVGLIQISGQGIVTAYRTMASDGHIYDSKCEATFADFMLLNKIDYLPHVGVGVYNHRSIQLRIDFLVTWQGRSYAIEIDGMGKLRRNLDNIQEKRRRCENRGWEWRWIPRDKVRYLCRKRCMVYWEHLVSLVNTYAMSS